MEILRFAPIVRVSTEKQEKQGESLNVQKSQIIDYVKSMGGTVPESCWDYSGQEHATPGQERLKLDKLLADSGKGLFDAVIVVDASRWSRDNLKSKEGLNILKANGIRFFIGTMESDLYNPAQNLFLGMSAEIGEFQAHQQALKSIMSQIHRAKQGIPASGSLPYGRIWEEHKWRNDPEKEMIIQQAAERYLSGKETVRAIATTLGFKSSSNLLKILSLRCGPNWEVSFRNDKVNVHEIVTIKIPELLDEETRSRIHEKIRASKSYGRKKIKYDYLINRMIFCATCEQPLNGSTSNKGKNRYYKQSAAHKQLPCRFARYIHAAEIESAVLLQLVLTLGDASLMQKAIAKASPNMEQVEGLHKEQNNWATELKKIATKKETIIDKIGEKLITDEDARRTLEKLREQETAVNNRLSVIENILSKIPDPKQVKRLSVFAGKVASQAAKNNPEYILKKPFDYQRKLVETAFGGRDAMGQRLGVYLTETEEGWDFEIRGLFGNSLLTLPLTDEYLTEAYHLDSEYQDVDKELEKIRTENAMERGRG